MPPAGFEKAVHRLRKGRLRVVERRMRGILTARQHVRRLVEVALLHRDDHAPLTQVTLRSPREHSV